MKTNIDILNENASPTSENWIEFAAALEANKLWLDKSAEIAAAALSALRKSGMSKKELAERMGVKPQFLSRVLKGSENLTLETIAKLEMALDTQLIKTACEHDCDIEWRIVYESKCVVDSKSFLGISSRKNRNLNYLS